MGTKTFEGNIEDMVEGEQVGNRETGLEAEIGEEQRVKKTGEKNEMAEDEKKRAGEEKKRAGEEKKRAGEEREKAGEEKEKAGEKYETAREQHQEGNQGKETAGEENEIAKEEVKTLQMDEDNAWGEKVEKEVEEESAEVEVKEAVEEKRAAEEEFAVKEKVGDLVEQTKIVEGGNIAMEEGKEAGKVEKKNTKQDDRIVRRDYSKSAKAETEVKFHEEVAQKSGVGKEVVKEVKTDRVKSRKAPDMRLKSNEGRLWKNKDSEDQKSISNGKAVEVNKDQKSSSMVKVMEDLRDLKSSSKIKIVEDLRDTKSSSKEKVMELTNKEKVVEVTNKEKAIKDSNKGKVVENIKQAIATAMESPVEVVVVAEKSEPSEREKGGEEVGQGEKKSLKASAKGKKSSGEELGEGKGRSSKTNHARGEELKQGGGSRSLNVRGSKTEAQANIWKYAQESNITEGKSKQPSNVKSKSTMLAPKVPEGITVKQQSSKTLKKVSTSGKQLAARKQSEAAMKYLEEQARATQAKEEKVSPKQARVTQTKEEKASPKQARSTQAKEEKATSAKVGRSSAEKRPQQSKTIGISADNQVGPPLKCARRSDEARVSPRKLEQASPKGKVPSRLFSTASEDLRMKGRPANAKSLRLMPLGRLRFYVREVIREGKCYGVRRGGADIEGFYRSCF